MSSERQIAANRRNSLKSTGPRTVEGRLRSSRNAVKHGIYSADCVVYAIGESDTSFNEHLASYLRTARNLDDPIEVSLLKSVATLDWQVSRLRRQEAGCTDVFAQDIFDRSVVPGTPDNPAHNPSFGEFEDSPHRGPNRLAGLSFVAAAVTGDPLDKISRHQQRHLGAYFRALKSLADYRNEPSSKRRKELPLNDKLAA